MLIHILQGLLVIILLASPFAIERLGLKDAAYDFHISNMRTTVDKGIVEYYSNYGTLPETLDEAALDKMGLSLEDTEGMTYEKISDREFSLTSANADKSYSFSGNSFRELPVRAVNEDILEEQTVEKAKLTVSPSINQMITVATTLPGGKPGITLHNGDSADFPKGTLFTANVSASEGYLAGHLTPREGKLNSDTQINITDAQLKMFDLFVDEKYGDISHQNITVKVNDTKSGQQLNLYNGDKKKVGYGSTFTATVKASEYGWLPGTLNYTSGVIKDNTTITITDATKEKYKISVDKPEHQTIKVTLVDPSTNKNIYLTNGESAQAERGWPIKGEVIADPGYIPGQIHGINSRGIVMSNSLVTADRAVKDDIVRPEVVDGIGFYLVDIGYSDAYRDWKKEWHFGFDGPAWDYDLLYNGDKFEMSRWDKEGKIITGPNTHYLLARFSSGSWRRLRADYRFKFNHVEIPTKDNVVKWDLLTTFYSDFRCIIKVEPNTVYPLSYVKIEDFIGGEDNEYQMFQVIIRDAPDEDVKVLSSTHATYLKSITMPGSKVIDELKYYYPNGKMLYFDATK